MNQLKNVAWLQNTNPSNNLLKLFHASVSVYVYLCVGKQLEMNRQRKKATNKNWHLNDTFRGEKHNTTKWSLSLSPSKQTNLEAKVAQ